MKCTSITTYSPQEVYTITTYSPQEVYKYHNILFAGSVQISKHTVRRKCTSIREQNSEKVHTNKKRNTARRKCTNITTYSPQEVYKYNNIQLIGSVQI